MSEWIDRAVREESLRRAQRLENELHDRDVVVVSYAGQDVVYRVPRWRKAPFRRAKIAWYRARRRLATRGTQ